MFLSNGAQTEVYGGDFVSTEPVFPSGDNSDLYNFLNHSVSVSLSRATRVLY